MSEENSAPAPQSQSGLAWLASGGKQITVHEASSPALLPRLLLGLVIWDVCFEEARRAAGPALPAVSIIGGMLVCCSSAGGMLFTCRTGSLQMCASLRDVWPLHRLITGSAAGNHLRCQWQKEGLPLGGVLQLK